jgi:hypothetical protein
MAFVEGQGVFGKVTFVDGTEPQYDRPYLIVGVYAEYIEVLNVSSIRGKEKKLAFPTNERLRVFRPPFIKPSFVKLDSLTKVPKSDWSKLKLLDSGNTLDAA